jgi:hypothetical protein
MRFFYAPFDVRMFAISISHLLGLNSTANNSHHFGSPSFGLRGIGDPLLPIHQSKVSTCFDLACPAANRL